VNAAKALGLLRALATPVFTTSDAAARLGLTVSAASKTLDRLRDAGLARLIRRGLWTVRETLEPLVLAEHLTAPHPAYVSLQTALHLHGMLEQIPAVIYVVSLARSQRIRTTLGTFSVHRVAPEFFGGFDLLPRSGAKVATPEKALLDVLYLSGGRSRLFASLPELELPAGLRLDRAQAWIKKIPSARLRTLVSRRLDALRATATRNRPARSSKR
jgi:predicted transcriptional regulator of viral defense system